MNAIHFFLHTDGSFIAQRREPTKSPGFTCKR